MTMQEAHERIEQANNEIAKLQEEIKRLQEIEDEPDIQRVGACLLYTSPSPRDA